MEMSAPASYGLLCLGVHEFSAFREALLERAWIREDSSNGRGDNALPSNAWNVLLSDSLDISESETLFTAMRGPVGVHQRTNVAPGAVVAPWQLVNHLPNAPALTHKASLIRALVRAGAGGGGGVVVSGGGPGPTHVFDTVPTTFYVPPGGTPGGGLDSPVLSNFFRRLAQSRNDAGASAALLPHMPPKQAMRGEWIVKSASGSKGPIGGVVASGLSEIGDACSALGGDFVLQKYLEKPLLIAGHKVTARVWVLVTDVGDAWVWKGTWGHLAPAVHVHITPPTGTSRTAATRSPLSTAAGPEASRAALAGDVSQPASTLDGVAPGGTLTFAELGAYLESTRGGYRSSLVNSLLARAEAVWLSGDSARGAAAALSPPLPPRVLDLLVLPRMKAAIADAVRGAFTAPMPPDSHARVGGGGGGGAPSLCPRAGGRGRRSFEIFAADFALDEDLRPWLLSFKGSPQLTKISPLHDADAAQMCAAAVAVAVDPLFPALPRSGERASDAEMLAAAGRLAAGKGGGGGCTGRRVRCGI